MDSRTELRPAAPRAVDLRRPPAPLVEIVDNLTYDFVLSIHVMIAALHRDLHEFDISKEWVQSAKARCDAADPNALQILGHYIGDDRPSSLQTTLISVIGLCSDATAPLKFLDCLRTLPAADMAEAILDQEEVNPEWSSTLRAALQECVTTGAPGPHTQRLLEDCPNDEWRQSALRVLTDLDGARAELIAALRVWYHAVFAEEEPRLAPLLRRDAEAMRRRRESTRLDDFLEREMQGVHWRGPRRLRRYIFVSSFYCYPAVVYHLLGSTLTFCAPTASAAPAKDAQPSDPNAPDDAVMVFFDMLGDQTRLSILRLLAGQQMYLTQLADKLNLRKATIKYHMVRLRAAGMVTLHERIGRERKTYYTLRPDVSRRAKQLLDGFLRTESDRRP